MEPDDSSAVSAGNRAAGTISAGAGIARHGQALARSRRGAQARLDGMAAEQLAIRALEADGWCILAQRLRTQAGEIDILAEQSGVLAVIEVKARPTLALAAQALGTRQQVRLAAAAACVLAEHPEWGRQGLRFDVIVVDAAGQVRRIADAFRPDGDAAF